MDQTYRKSSVLSDKQNMHASPSSSSVGMGPWDRTSSSPLLLSHRRMSGWDRSWLRRPPSSRNPGRYNGDRSQTRPWTRQVHRARRRQGWASCLRPYILVPFEWRVGPWTGLRSYQVSPSLLGRGACPANHSGRGLKPTCSASGLRNHTLAGPNSEGKRKGLATAGALTNRCGSLGQSVVASV